MPDITLKPQELALALRENDALLREITAEEGASLLHYLAKTATERIRSGALVVTEGVIALDIIRTQRLHDFAGQTWGTFLNDWLDENGMSKSLVYSLLRVARVWTGPSIGQPIGDLLLYAEGIHSVKPLLDPDDKDAIVQKTNRETGEILEIKNGWDAKLPAAETLGDQVRLFIEQEVAHEDTAATARDLARNTNPKDKFEFFPRYKTEDRQRILVDVTWLWTPPEQPSVEGRSLSDMPSEVIRELFSRLRVGREWRK